MTPFGCYSHSYRPHKPWNSFSFMNPLATMNSFYFMSTPVMNPLFSGVSYNLNYIPQPQRVITTTTTVRRTSTRPSIPDTSLQFNYQSVPTQMPMNPFYDVTSFPAQITQDFNSQGAQEYQEIPVSTPDFSQQRAGQYQIVTVPTPNVAPAQAPISQVQDNTIFAPTPKPAPIAPTPKPAPVPPVPLKGISSAGPKTKLSMPFNSFDEALIYHESRGIYMEENQFGFLGKYQLGEEIMRDIGYYKNDGNLLKNDWKNGFWTGKDGLYSKWQFLSSPKLQDKAYNLAKKYKWKAITSLKLDRYIGRTINGVVITPSGLLGGAYALGEGNLQKYLESNGKISKKDGNSLGIDTAIARYSGFDISDITG